MLRWLDEAAPDDSVVRAEVRSLLDHHSRAGSFLTQPVAEAAPHLLAEEHTLEPGTALGSYTIVREIGRGGMGRVYLATDARLGRTVALKALPPQLTRDPIHRDRLRREARAAAVLTHPGICTVYALEELDGELYIATEFVEGHTLRDEILEGKRPSLEMIITTARELASAWPARTPKASRIAISSRKTSCARADGRIKVLDFGLARVEAGPGGIAATLTAQLPGGIAGTPAYMSPEQIEGRTAGPASDVFSCGRADVRVDLRPPSVHGGSALATLARVLDSTPDPLASHVHLPAGLSAVIDRCLRKPVSETIRCRRQICCRRSIIRRSSAAQPAPSSTWWRTHQLVAIMLYTIASAHAWQIKEWFRQPIPLWVFVLIGIAGSVGGIIRGHLILRTS